MNLIFDRTQSDVDKSKELLAKMQNSTITDSERAEYMRGLKGCYNISDMNRVESAVEDVSDRLNALSYSNTVTVRTSWGYTDIIKQLDIERCLHNLSVLRSCYYVLSDTPSVPAISEWIDYIVANSIEKMLHDINLLIGNMLLHEVYVGQIELGGGELI